MTRWSGGVQENSPCAACGVRIGNHKLWQFITCRAKLGLMHSLEEMFPAKNEQGQYNFMSLVWGIVALILVLVILRAFGVI